MPLDARTLRAWRTPIMAGLLVVALAVTLAVLTNANQQGPGEPSSYNTLKYGGKAAYLLLLQTGYPVERWEQPVRGLPLQAEGVTLIIANPRSSPDPEDLPQVRQFVARGGRVLMTGDGLADFGLPDSSDWAKRVRVGHEVCGPASPTRLSRAGLITMEGAQRWRPHARDAVVHYRDSGGNPVVVSYALGKGEVIWWADSLPLTNIGLRDQHNVELLLASVAGSRRILWDEYSHQLHAQQRGDQSYREAFRWARWQIVALAAALVFAYSRRSGPIVPLERPSRLSPLEFVQTMGEVFHKADARQAALEIAFARLRLVATRRLALPPEATAEEIAARMTEQNWGMTKELARQLCEAEAAMSDPYLKDQAAIFHARIIHKVLAILEAEHKRYVGNGTSNGRD